MSHRIRLFNMEIDAINMTAAVSRLSHWLDQSDGACRYVVTPNVDHAILFQENQQLREAYDDAEMILADGMPVVLASRLLRCPLPERVAGSDLVPALFDAADTARPMRVFLLGAMPGVAAKAAKNIEQKWQAVQVCGFHSPPLGFENDEQENLKILELIADARPDVLIVAFGAPKQELWVHAHHDQIQAKVALCAGATIDFLAGDKPRAPKWMRRSGLEWVHRLVSEPRRLTARYARDAWLFPQLVWKEWRAIRRSRAVLS